MMTVAQAEEAAERVKRAVLQALAAEPTNARSFDAKIAEKCGAAVVEVLREVGQLGRLRRTKRPKWRIENRGRAWGPEEALQRWGLTPEKFELIDGRLFGSEAERLNLLGLLLENEGADNAVRLGDPQVWRRAVAQLPGG